MSIDWKDLDIVAESAIVLSVITFFYTFYRDRKMDRRVKSVEAEQLRERQEAVLRQSRASAPFFSPSKSLAAQVYDTNDKGELIRWSWAQGNFLFDRNREMPKSAEPGTPVIVLLATNRKTARNLRISGDLPSARICQEPDMEDAKDAVFLKYPYSPKQHGELQRIIISFETDDGYQLTHTYEMRHGFFEFRRVDPP